MSAAEVERMAEAKFLYGYEGAEQLNDDPEDVAEYLWDSAADEFEGPFLVEKWTVAPARKHLPESWRVLDFIAEWTSENGEVDEGFDDHMADLLHRPGVVAQVEAMLDFIAARIGYRMADQLVDTQMWWRRDGKFVRQEPTGLCSAHRDGEDPNCRICYPLESDGDGET